MTRTIARSIALAALAAGAGWAQQVAIATTSPLTAATIGTAYTQTFSATGGSGSYTWSASGQPGWLGMSSGGVLSGTPPSTAITSTFTVTVTDANDATNFASGQFTLPVVALSITTTSLPDGTVGVAYAQTLAASGGAGGHTNWTVVPG